MLLLPLTPKQRVREKRKILLSLFRLPPPPPPVHHLVMMRPQGAEGVQGERLGQPPPISTPVLPSSPQPPIQVSPSGPQPPPNFEPQIPDFVGQSGIQFDPSGFTEIDFFKLFFSEELISLMVVQTNLYAQQFLAQHPVSSFFSGSHSWTPVDAAEMTTFWGLLLHMGLVKKPRIRQYWSVDILYNTPIHRMAMTRHRFEAILKFLHYNDNARCPPRDDPSYDRLYKIRPVIDHLAAKFSEVYIPGKYISIDESLVSFKGRVQFRQYLPSKRARYGIKLYKLCESTSGYTHRFRVYEGRDTHIQPPECPPTLGVSGKLVWELMFPLLDKGYHLYVDNFYTSLPLFKSLSTRATVACGTVRKNQRGLPSHPVAEVLRRGVFKAHCSDNMLLVKYKDKRDVLILTTIHGPGTTPVPVRGTTAVALKPDCILDYNRYMGGVDLSDQVLKPYSALRKTNIWYKKLAVHMVQTAMYNAFVLYRCAGHPGKYLQFQEAVVKALIFCGGEGGGPSTSAAATGGPRIVPGQHFPGEVPHTGKKGKSQKKCRVCYKKGFRKDTCYQCDTCPDKPGLCMKECFKTYHTSMEY
ncbi:piggyBac transposable element-derived protein 4-like [Dendropsophus ebraccatus]|uniref:piggyBac transposable element-derived protein 4-like n=1 Tax=Dendropsophus ebraccatus TaxID=150705 RepID=UPI0038322E47